MTILALAGCGSEDPSSAPDPTTASEDATAVPTTGGTLRIQATWKLPPGSAMVATPDRLWVLGGPSGALTQIDPKTNTVIRTLKPPHPPGFGTYADGSLWIASFLDDAVMQLDADSGRVLRTLESSHGRPFFGPVGIAAAGHDLWVLNHGDDTVRSTLTRVDARTGTATGRTDLPGHGGAGPLLVDGRLWITMTAEGTVVRVDPRTGRLVDAPIVIATGTCLGGSTADGDLWYAGLDDEEGGTCRTAARRVDARNAQLSPVVYGPGSRLFDFASASGSVWASDVGRTIYRVDVDSGAVLPRLTLHGPVATNRMVAAFGSLWVLGGETGRLVRVDVR
jgi:streptogramin lyase